MVSTDWSTLMHLVFGQVSVGLSDWSGSLGYLCLLLYIMFDEDKLSLGFGVSLGSLDLVAELLPVLCL